MKKVLTLLALLVTTLAAMATDFSDKCTLSWQDVYGNTVNPCEASVTDNGDGTSTIVLKSLTFYIDTDAYPLGDLTFTGVTTSKSGDVTTYSLTDATKVSFENCTASSFTKPSNCSAVALSAKSQGDRLYAEVTLSFKIGYTQYISDMKVVYGTDDFGGSTSPDTEVTEVETKTYNGTWTSDDGQFDAFTGTVKVTEYSDGTYAFAVPNFAPLGSEMGGFTIPNVMGGMYEDKLNFAFEGEEESYINVTYDGTAPEPKVNYVDSGTGYVDGDNLYMLFDRINYGNDLRLTNVSFAPTDESGETPDPSTPEESADKTFSGTWSNSGSTTFTPFEGEITTTENSDGTYTFTVKDFTISEIVMGNFTIDNVPATTTDGVTTFDFTYGGTKSWITPNYGTGDTAPGSAIYYMMGVTGTLEGNTLKLQVSSLNSDGGYFVDVAYNGTLKGEETPDPTPEPGETTEQTFNGTWSNAIQPSFTPFTGDVTVTQNTDGTYTFSVKEFTLRSLDFGGFTIENVPATTTDGVTTFDFTYGGTIQYVIPVYPTTEDTGSGEQTTPQMKVTVFIGLTGTMQDNELKLYASAFNSNAGYYQQVSYNGTLKGEETPEEPTVVSTDTYNERMTLNDGWQDYEFDTKTVNVLKYSDDTYALQFVAFEKNAEDEMSRWGDLTFKGLTYTDNGDGTATLAADGLTATVTDETSTYCGSEATLKLTGTKNAEGKLVLDFTVSGSLETLGTYNLTGTYGYDKPAESNPGYYKGTWNSAISSIDEFEGEVKPEKNDDGTYTFYVKNFTYKGNEVGGFNIPDVSATEAEDGTVTFTANTVYTSYVGEKPSTGISYAQGVTGQLKDKVLTLNFRYLGYGYEELGSVSFNGTLEAEETPEEPTVVATDVYDERMTLNDGWQDYEFDDKTVNVLKYSDGTYALQFVAFEKDAEDEMSRWGDLTFKGLTYTEAEDGTATLAADGLTATVMDETSTYYGSEAKLTLSGVKNSEGQLVFEFTVTGSLETLGSYTLTGTYGYPKPEPKSYKGTWNSYVHSIDDFEGKVKLTKNSDGTYSFYVENFTVKGNEVGGFTIPNVPATEDADGVSFSISDNVNVVYDGEEPSTPITYVYNISGSLKGNTLSLTFIDFYYGTEELDLVLFNGTLESDETPEEPTVVATDAYDERMTLNDGWQDYEFDDKTVNVLKYSDGTYALQFVAFEKDAEDEMSRWGDLTFKGLTYTEAEDGTATLAADGLTATVMDETSTYYGSEAKLTLSGVKNSEGQLVFEFTVTGSLETLGTYTLTGTYGYPKPEPKDTVTYTDVAEVTLNGNVTTFAEKVLKVADNGDGTYDFVYPDFNAGADVLGDVTLRGVTATTDEETGVVSFSFEGNATIDNLNGLCAMYYDVASEQPFTMTGTLQDGKLIATFNTSTETGMYDFVLKNVFGYQTPTGISNVETMNLEGCEVYSINGTKLNGLQRGVNIVRKADGTTIKVMKK